MWPQFLSSPARLPSGRQLRVWQGIIAHCRKNLTAYKIPRKITWIEELPKSGVGKILRRELRNL